MRYTCQCVCPESSDPVNIKVNPSDFTWSSREWSFQHNDASVLYEPIMKIANGYYHWLRQAHVWQTRIRGI